MTPLGHAACRVPFWCSAKMQCSRTHLSGLQGSILRLQLCTMEGAGCCQLVLAAQCRRIGCALTSCQLSLAGGQLRSQGGHLNLQASDTTVQGSLCCRVCLELSARNPTTYVPL